MFDRRLFKNFDYQLFLIMLLLCIYGLFVISSATQGLPLEDPSTFVRKQAVWMVLGFAVMLFVISIDYINYYRWSPYFYLFNLLFLLLVIFIGKEAGGASRWINLYVFDFQPSELAKVIIIISFARLLVDYKDRLEEFSGVLLLLLYIVAPILLIFLQPDLGTALVFIVIFFGMLYMAGVPARYLGLLAGAGMVAFPLLWSQLQDYQKMRLIVFINPELDPLGYGYQLTQSVIAIGSGGFSGKGIYEGTQARLQFLPAQHTDFIFSVLGEEMGFFGALILLLLYFFLIYRILKIASLSKDSFGALICTGVATIIIFQVLVNIGMALSIMPVTGLPLPFMSYGGNSIIMNMTCIAMVLNVGMRRHKIQF